MWLILNGYRDTVFWIYKYKSIVNVNKEELLTAKLYFIFKLMFKWQICYTEEASLFQFTINVKNSHRQP
jgi:hypothetical protein